MKKSIKKALIVGGVALLVCLVGILGVVWLELRSSELNEAEEPVAAIVSDPSRGPSFAVRVIMPRMGLPLGGILPDALVKKLDATPREMRFDHTSPGARIRSVESDHLELSADGWNLFIEADGEGRVAPETHLVFELALGGRKVTLDCRPADRPAGYLRTITRSGSDDFSGRFLVQLANCKNVASGKTSNWPPAPLTVRGSFANLPNQRR